MSASDYITELRALVGTRPLILPGSSVVLVDESGRLLLIERADTGGWGLPGGFMEPGESFEDAARREVREELGIEIAGLSLLGVFSGPECYYRYPNGDEVFNVTAAFLADAPADAVFRPDPGEVRSFRFFDPEHLPPDLLVPERPIANAYTALQRRPR
ncbi:NUDIX hydrolase [Actinocorallia populi]|uniref:NUDIX hydrolase n=1 Tax=Actinocorallia populi TaxID=2079200 RepID=UPI000D08A2A2|nr:NUDIX hydrolase [Actinocorallia populi]